MLVTNKVYRKVNDKKKTKNKRNKQKKTFINNKCNKYLLNDRG